MKFSYATKVAWSFKTCGIFVEQMEVIRLFENLLSDMETIKCKDIMYSKYTQAAKEIQTKLCFPEAESCIHALVAPPTEAGEDEEGEEAGSFL